MSADGTFSWLATDAAAQHQVTVRVTDPDGAFDEATFLVTVNLDAENNAPTLAAVPDQAIATGQVLILTLDGADAEDADEALTYSLVSGPAGAAVSASGQFSWQAGATGAELSDYLARAAAHVSILELADAGALTDKTAIFDQ